MLMRVGKCKKNVSDGDFIDDENDVNKNVEDYCAFTDVSRSVEESNAKLILRF